MYKNRCEQTLAWDSLKNNYQKSGFSFDLRKAFLKDPIRFEKFSQYAPFIFADLSKNYLDEESEGLLFDLANQTGLSSHRDAMFSGHPINNTESCAALHTLLRFPSEKISQLSTEYGLRDKAQQACDTLTSMLLFAKSVRDDLSITDIVNIGIGGSDLGSKMAIHALQELTIKGKRFHFVANIDGYEISRVLGDLNPKSCLFIISSKSFTTQDTISNALSAKHWFLRAGGIAVEKHFCAVTNNLTAAKEFGVHTSFPIWDWVGGRYSVWSAMGLPLAIAIGEVGFRSFLNGAHQMDEHFRVQPITQNLPVRLGLLDIWYRNFYKFTSRNVAPYSSALKELPFFLQQLEMESNGKSVDSDGQALTFSTSPVIWGQAGSSCQHSFFQMLHQGSDVTPIEFIAIKKSGHDLVSHHEAILANALAQAQAFMFGQENFDNHKKFKGNIPSTFLVMDDLSPKSLGSFLALQEHRVFVSGSIWGINSFDQWGVELGKSFAKDIQSRMQTGILVGLDSSTAGLLKILN